MKSTLIDTGIEPKEKEYPVLKKQNGSGIVVLFIKATEGVVVWSPNNEYSLGFYSKVWDMHYFEDLEKGQQVILEND